MKIRKGFAHWFFLFIAFLIALFAACQSQEVDPMAQLQEEAEEAESLLNPETQQLQMAEGELRSVDPETGALTILTPRGEELDFKYDEWTEISGSQETVEGLSTHGGAQIQVHYVEDGADRLALRIEIGQSAEESNPEQ